MHGLSPMLWDQVCGAVPNGMRSKKIRKVIN